MTAVLYLPWYCEMGLWLCSLLGAREYDCDLVAAMMLWYFIVSRYLTWGWGIWPRSSIRLDVIWDCVRTQSRPLLELGMVHMTAVWYRPWYCDIRLCLCTWPGAEVMMLWYWIVARYITWGWHIWLRTSIRLDVVIWDSGHVPYLGQGLMTAI